MMNTTETNYAPARKRTGQLDVWRDIVTRSHLQTEVVEIDPVVAKEWLELNVANRKLRQSTIDRYASDMKNNRWQLTHQGIAFDIHGNLVDGQHRLSAVVKSGATIKIQVTFGIRPQEVEVLDFNLARTVADVAQKDARFAAIGRRMMLGMDPSSTRNVTQTEVVSFIRKHGEAIDFVMSMVGYRIPKVTSASVLAPVSRAYYSSDHSKLRQFMSILISGFPDSQENVMRLEDQTVIALRNLLLGCGRGGGLANRGSSTVAQDIYGRTERALQGFLQGEKLTRIFPVDHELFPLPEETVATKTVRTRRKTA